MVDKELIRLKKDFNKKLDKIIRKDILSERKHQRRRRKGFPLRKGVNASVKRIKKNTPNFMEQAAEVTQI